MSQIKLLKTQMINPGYSEKGKVKKVAMQVLRFWRGMGPKAEVV